MKALFLIASVFFSFQSFASLDMSKLAGTWSTNCVQILANGKKGFAIESYTFKEPQSFDLRRDWYTDAQCTKANGADEEKGTIKIGDTFSKNAFNPKGTFEAEYTHQNGTDKGLIWTNEDHSRLRVARGFGKEPNTMLGLFVFTKGLTKLKL